MSMPLANGTGSSVDEGVQSLLFLATLILAWVGVSQIRGTGFQRLPRAVGWIALVLAGARPSPRSSFLPSSGRRSPPPPLDRCSP